MSELNQYEKKVYSQNGEDGIIEEIFNRIGTTNKYFVEFGVETGEECNARYLHEKGWKGLMIEGSEEMHSRLKDNYDDNVQTVHSFITKDNIVDIFKSAQVPTELDLLSVDIDGNDYWVLKSILEGGYEPQVIVVEYNAIYPPPAQWIMKYNAEHVWDGTSYQGASLQSLYQLCLHYGYLLVGTDSRGVNAFFVRHTVEGINLPMLKPHEAYHPAKYIGHLNNGHYGHPYRYGEYTI